MKKKGFTLIELLVVIAIIALLMGMLMPALALAKSKAMVLVCGANLGGLGKAMLVYASDHGDNFPRAGGPKSTWDISGFCGGTATGWRMTTALQAYGMTGTQPGKVTVTASIYLLVKGNNITPAQTVCKSDGAKEFKVSLERPVINKSLEEVWDFGANGGKTGVYCGYAYQMPYYSGGKSFAVDDTWSPDTPVLADRNPHLDMRRPAGGADKVQPSFSHNGKGQNVWFKNGSREWLKDVTVGIGGDNIYCYGAYGADIRPTSVGGTSASIARTDSFLVSERNGTLP